MVSAQDFPTRPITWIVPFAPGGITDTNSRIVADEMSKVLGQSIIVDNRAGGGGIVGTEQVARAKPDGYTMIYGTQSTMASSVSLRKSLPYDPLKSFVPVHMLAGSANVLVATKDAPFNSVPELIAYAKQNPGKLSYGSAGVGTATHLLPELFKTVTGTDIVHVPYKGSAPALNDLMTGRIDMAFDYALIVGPHVDAGKLKILAVTAPARLDAMPDVPTMVEFGLKDITTEAWSGIMVPAGTPEPIIDRLAAAARIAVMSEKNRYHLEKVGSRAMMQQKAEMRAFIETEIALWADVVAKTKIEKQ